MKLGQIYNLKSFSRFCDSASAPGFADASAGALLARSLTAINPKIFEKRYPELSFINSGIDVDNSGGYARRIQSLRLIDEGGFTTAGDASTNKGKISLSAEDSFLPVIVRESHSIWTDDEIKEAELGNINLPSRFIAAHNKIYLRELDEIGLVGKDEISEGLLNNSLFDSSSASGAITTLTPQEMYDEMATLITDQHNSVLNTPEYMANRVAMPTAVMNTLKVTILNSAAGSSSVLRALQDNFPGVVFYESFRAASVGGASATVAYSNSDDSMVMRVPVPLTIGEVVKLNSFDFRVDSKYRVAGLDVLEASSGRILTGL